MSKVNAAHERSGQEALEGQVCDLGKPGSADMKNRHTAVGVRFVDASHRCGNLDVGLLDPGPCATGFETIGHISTFGAELSNSVGKQTLPSVCLLDICTCGFSAPGVLDMPNSPIYGSHGQVLEGQYP